MKKIRVTRSIIPNLFTLMNLFCGFIAITRIAENQFVEAALLIMVASVFDALDGAVARLTKSTSELGVELDSLCDAVSFGLAPSFMVYQACFHAVENFGLVLAALPALAGTYRLARFNVQLSGFGDKRYFSGMPIPSGALTLISYVIFFHEAKHIPPQYSTPAMVIVTILVAAVMISTVKFDNLPRFTRKAIKERPLVFLYFSVGGLAILLSKGALLFPFMIMYIIGGLLRHAFGALRNRYADEDSGTLEEEEADPLEM